MRAEGKVYFSKRIHCITYTLSNTTTLAKVTMEAFKTRNLFEKTRINKISNRYYASLELSKYYK